MTTPLAPATPRALVKTESLDCAAFLRAKGHQLMGTSRDLGTLTIFVFPPEAAADLEAFYNGGLICAEHMGLHLRELKKLLPRVRQNISSTPTRKTTHGSEFRRSS
jgi:hypothetical protein